MTTEKVSSGTAHTVPKDLREIFLAKEALYILWEDITPLARNEWICWITSAKKEETRERRIKIMVSKLLQGDRRPCCWAGCTHR